MSRIFSYLMILFLLATTIWVIGLVWFIGEVPQYSNDKTTPAKADIGVVLTGGQGRITHGLIMLYEKRVPQLIISGVNADVSNKDLFSSKDNPLKAKLYNANKHLIILGREAGSTHENADEVKKILVERPRVKSMLLVTTNYHMPRSMYEFTEAFPNYTIIGEPVFSPKFPINWWKNKDSILLLVSEYNKLIISSAMKNIGQDTPLSEFIKNNSL